MAPQPLNFGERVRTARKEAKLTLAELARCLGVDVRTVARWQTADGPRPSYERLVELARVVGKPPSYFLDDDSEAAA